MATGRITLDTGSTLSTTTYTISEDGVTKHIPRSTLNNSSGVEIGVATAPLIVSPSNGTITSITNAVTITGSVISLGTNSTVVLGTCSTVVLNTVTVTGGTSVLNRGLQPGRFKSQLDSANVTGATTVVAAVSNATTYISAYFISALVAGTYWLEDGSATAITPRHYFAANGGISFLAAEGMPIATAITNTTVNLKSSVVGSVGCLVLGYTA